jgi:hypothetical protein
MSYVYGQTGSGWQAHLFLATLASDLPNLWILSRRCPEKIVNRLFDLAAAISTAIMYVPLASCRKTLRSRTLEFGFFTTVISFHSLLFLKNVRTPNAAPQYKFRPASSPFASAAGTGTIP